MNSRPVGLTDGQYIELLTRQLQEANDVLEAIRTGSVDALFIQGDKGEKVYTLDNADKPYRLLVEQMQEGAVTISADGVIFYANQRFGEIVGSPLEQIFGQPFQRFIGESDIRIFERFLAAPSSNSLRTSATLHGGDCRQLPGYLSFSRLPEDFSGEPIYCGVVTDLTDQKLMEARLHQSQKMEALGQLTGGLAHDFNNLLQAIQGSFDLIIRRPDSEKIVKWAKSGLTVADRGAKLTSQLLAFSRSQKLELQVCLIGQVITGMTDLLKTTLGSSIDLNIELDAPDAQVLTDPVQLELAILNLAINGRDAMSGTGCLTIGARHTARHDRLESAIGFVEIRVVDTGTGMSEEVRQHAFNPFFTTKDVGQGTGLGLSQVESIVQQSNGAVHLTSEPGQGTSIFLTIPCAEAQEMHEDEAPSDSPSLIAKLKILVIDDDDEVRGTLVEMLDVLGHVAFEASSGMEGIAMVESSEIDLVLLDYAMPVMNGAEAAKAIHRAKPHTPIIFVSGYSDTDQLRSAMNDYTALLRKPFTIDGLQNTVQAMLNV